jgi:4-hydroxybenzoate polyprenyltransferase
MQTADATRADARGSLLAIAALMRAGTCVAAAILTVAGDRTSAAPVGGWQLVTLALSIALIVGFAQAYNDIVDRDIDARTKPHRPLPAAALSLRTAYVVTASCAGGGIALAAAGGLRQVAFAVVLVALSGLYSRFLKGTVLIGNVTVAALASTAVPYGGLDGGLTKLVLAAQVVVFVFSVAFEIVKTARDVDGDAAAGLVTVATRFGLRRTAQLGGACSLISAPLAALPALVATHPWRYLVVMGVLGIAPTIVAGVRLLWSVDDEQSLAAAFRVLRFAWAGGATCLLVLP